MIRTAIALILSAAVLTAGGPGIAAEPMQLVVDGQTRTFVLERPAASGPRPTLIVLHGAGGSGARETQSGFWRSAPQAGFVAVFPDGRANRWNHLPPGRESAQLAQAFQQHGGAPDDVAFLKVLVADLVRRGISDPKRVYLAGISAGGVMTLRMACLGERAFAAIGLLVASMPEVTGAGCSPSRPLPVLMISGTADDVMPYGGGFGVLPNTTIKGIYSVWPAERMAAFFRQHNGCAEPADKSVASGHGPHRVEVERSTRCSGGPVHFHRVVGGDHDLRNRTPDIGRWFVDFFRGAAIPAAPVAAAPPVTTASADDQRLCFSGAAGDANITACGRLIASHALRGGDLIRVLMQRGILLARKGDDHDRVIADASEILRLDPNDVHALLLRGGSYQRKGDSGRARADVNRALQLGPRSGLAYNALSNYYNMTGEHDRALTMANESLRIAPGNAYGRKNRAESLEHKGQLEEALAEFRAVLAVDPQRQERLGRESAAAIQRIELKLRATHRPKPR